MSYGINAPQGLVPFSSITGGSWVDKFNQYQIDPTYRNAAYSASQYASYFSGDPIAFTPAAPTADAPNTGNVVPYLPIFGNAVPSTFSTHPVVGSFSGCTYTDVTGKFITDDKWIGGTPTYIGTTVNCLVSDAPNVVYDIQISTHINAGDVGGGVIDFISKPNFPNVNTTVDRMGTTGSNFAFGIGNNATPPAATNFNTVLIPGGGGAFYTNNPASGNTASGESAYYLDVSTAVGGDITRDYDKRAPTLPLKVIGLSSKNVAGLKADGTPQTLALTPFINVFAVINNHAYGHNVFGTVLA